jgi:hypothetical protein
MRRTAMTPTTTTHIGIADDGTVYRADSGHSLELQRAIFGGDVVEVTA